jgi:hypothetical protein
MFYNGKVVSVEPPNFVELTVVDCPPNVKGNTASGGEAPVPAAGLALQAWPCRPGPAQLALRSWSQQGRGGRG